MPGRESETAVIAIDNSYSMGQSDGGPTRFDLARQAAVQMIDAMPPGSSAAVLLFSDVVRAPIPEPTFDLDLARKVVRDAAISDRTTDVKQVVGLAQEILARHPAGGQRIYLVTDGQANGWNPFEEITKMLRSQTVRSTVLLVGSPEDHNLCVSNLQLASSMASVGEAAQFDVEVTNYGSGEANDVDPPGRRETHLAFRKIPRRRLSHGDGGDQRRPSPRR
jgi:Mg-chelatase subunit ChlD